MNDGAYDEALTTDEEALLAELNGEPATDAPLDAPSGDKADPVAADPVGDPAAPAAPAAPDAEPAAGDDQQFAAFLEQHKGKSPEELARIAFQQSRRANTAGFQARRTQEQLEAVNERVRAAVERAKEVREANTRRRQDFNATLEQDPDAAARTIHDRELAAEEAAADAAVREAEIDAAIGLASAAIPDFAKKAPSVLQFGQEMNYSQAELNGIRDGRDLVVLTLASFAGNLIKSGLMDVHGQLREMPKAIDDSDPRLSAPAAPKTLSSAPGRSAGGGKTADQQATDFLSMTDADFAKLSDAEIDALMKQLEA